jgi:hypothetical protein
VMASQAVVPESPCAAKGKHSRLLLLWEDTCISIAEFGCRRSLTGGVERYPCGCKRMNALARFARHAHLSLHLDATLEAAKIRPLGELWVAQPVA